MSEVPHKAFWERTERTLGQACTAKLRDALLTPPSVSVRLHPFKTPAGEPLFPLSRAVSWSEEGRMLPERPAFTLDPAFHAGAYYVQDSSAMAVGEAFRRSLDLLGGLDRPVRVLDACAAPGGKTTDAAASLRKAFGDGFLLVANEVMRQRASVLKDNVALWGDPCVSVTSADPAAFGNRLGGFFDAMIADVPCSGEGMFRKDPDAVRDWSEDTVRLCAARQRRILSDLWPSLREGGILVYSTCTFAPEENGENVSWIASELGAEIVTPSMPFPGAVAMGGGYAFIPGMVEGEGQFVAVLRKIAPEGRFSLPKIPRTAALLPKGLLNRSCLELQRGLLVVAVPEPIAPEALALEPMRPLSTGVAAGEWKGKDFIPDADLALSLLLSPGAFPSVELARVTALSFLHRDAIVLPGAPKGVVRVDWRGLPLGFVKNLGPRCNSLHPKDRRIRMDI